MIDQTLKSTHMLIKTQWAATFTTMNFVSGMPVLFGFAMYVYALCGLNAIAKHSSSI